MAAAVHADAHPILFEFTGSGRGSLTDETAQRQLLHRLLIDVLALEAFALFRIARHGEDTAPGRRRAAGVLFVLMSASLLAPGGIYLLPYPWNNVYVLGQTLIWLLVLLTLVLLGRRRYPSQPRSAPRRS